MREKQGPVTWLVRVWTGKPCMLGFVFIFFFLYWSGSKVSSAVMQIQPRTYSLHCSFVHSFVRSLDSFTQTCVHPSIHSFIHVGDKSSRSIGESVTCPCVHCFTLPGFWGLWEWSFLATSGPKFVFNSGNRKARQEFQVQIPKDEDIGTNPDIHTFNVWPRFKIN